MALTDRRLVREEISDLFNDITELQENVDYPVLKLEGKSPVLTTHGDGTQGVWQGRNVSQLDHFFIVTIFINRAAHGDEGAEDLLDKIYSEVMQRLRNNPTGTAYRELEPSSQRSAPAFATIDGIPYRVEELRVMARSNPSG